MSIRFLLGMIFSTLAALLALLGGGSAAVVTVSLTVDVLNFNTTDTPIAFFTRAFNGHLSGPVIRVTQGDTLKIHLDNRLTADIDGPRNTFRLANTTNLHLHGMHISPMGSADDVFRHITPNSSGWYEYQIPKDHSAGTFWYHPHVHGSSSLQAGGGMAGALIVEPADQSMLPAALVAMDEEVLLLQHLCFHNTGKYHSSTPYINHLEVVKYGLDTLAPNPTYRYPNDVKDYYMVNGQFKPNITMRPGQFKLFRLIGAGTSAFLELQVVSDNRKDSSAQSCDVFIVAKDGIFVERAYLEQSPLLVPGSRLDLAVRCNSSGHYRLESAANTLYNSQLLDSTAVFDGTLAGLVVTGAPMTMEPPNELPSRPSYMPDLLNATVLAAHQLALSFETVGGPFAPGPPYPPMHINGKSFSTKDNFVANMSLGVVQEWVVQIAGDSNLGAGNHPFHLHVNPFQVVAIGGSQWNPAVLGVKVGEYRDTLPLSQSSSYTIRFRPDRFTGRALIHCHMIPHVDFGMAAVAAIVTSSSAL
jgi:FtsP/CotA-like multicopper oxidase with cupredoxin domain